MERIRVPRVLLLVGAILLAAPAHVRADPPTPGDANLDGFVDDIDYAIWAENYEPGVGGKTWGQGDFNGDGVVDGADYTIWAANYQSIPFRGDVELTNLTGAAKTDWPVFLTIWKVFGGGLDMSRINPGGFHVYDSSGTEIPHMVRHIAPDFSLGNDEIVFLVPSMAAGQTLSYIITNTAEPGLTQAIDVINNPNNLLPNGGFETDVGGVPTGYFVAVNHGVSLSYDTQVKHSGSRSLKMTFLVGSDATLKTTSAIPIQSGGHYHFSIWVKTENVAYNGYGFYGQGGWINFEPTAFTGRETLTLRDDRKWFCYRFDSGSADSWAVPAMASQGRSNTSVRLVLGGDQDVDQPFLAGDQTGRIWFDEALLFAQPRVTVDRQTPLRRHAKNGAVIFSRPVNSPQYKAFAPEAVKKFQLYAMKGERRRLRFGVHAVRTINDLSIHVTELTGPGGTLSGDDLDLEKFGGSFVVAYETTLELAAGNTVEYLLSINVPDALAAGTYTGAVVFTSSGGFIQVLPLALEVLPVQVPSMADTWVGGIYNIGYALDRDDRFYRCYGKVRFNYIMLFDYFAAHIGSLDPDLPYAQQQVDKLAALSHLTGGIGLYREPNMSEDQPRMWYQIATGDPTYPGPYPNKPNTNTFPQYEAGYQALAVQLETHALSNDWPTLIYMVSDEPDYFLDWNDSMGWLNEALPDAITVADTQFHDMLRTWDWYNLPILDDPADWTGPLMYDYVKAHKGRFGICGTRWGLAAGRYQGGLMMAASGACYWHWWHTHGPFDYLEGNVVRMHHVAAMGAGVNDLRYYLTLKEKIAASSNPTLAAQAQAYLDGIFDFCTADHDRHLLPYNGVPTDWGYHRFYDDWRATMKDYILLLDE